MARVYQSTSVDPSVTADDMSNMSKLLNQLGISVRDTTGAFVPFNELLREIADKESNLTDSQKMAINIQASGTRQANIFQNALDTVAKSEKLANDALNSNGELLTANGKYMETASAKAKVLSASINAMWQNMVSSNVIKGALDGLNELVKVFGNLPTILGLATTALLLWKGAFITQSIVKSVTNALLEMDTAMGAMSITEMTLAGITKTLNTLWVENPIGIVALAITSVITLYDVLTQAVGNSTTAIQGQIDKITESSSKIQQEQQDVNGLKDRLSTLDELHKKTSLTNDDKTQLKNVNTELTNNYPELISYYDKESQSFQVSIKDLQDLITQKEKLAMMDNANNLDSSKTTANNAQDAIDKANMELLSGKKVMGEGTKNPYVVNLSKSDRDEILAYIKEETTLRDAGNKTVNQSTQLINDYISAQEDSGKSYATIISDLKAYGYSQTQIDDALKLSIGITHEHNDAQSDGIKTQEELIKAYQDSVGKIKDYNQILHDLKSNDEQLKSSTMNDIIKNHAELIPYLSNEKELINKVTQSIEDEKKTANDAYRDMMMSSDEYYNDSIKGTDKIKNALGDYYSKLSDAQKNDLQNAKNLAQAKAIIEKDLIDTLGKAWDSYYKAVDSIFLSHAELARQVDNGDDTSMLRMGRLLSNSVAVTDAIEKAKGIQSRIDGINTSFDSIGASISPSIFYGDNYKDTNSSGGSNASSTENQALITKDRYASLNQTLAETNTLLAENKSLQDSVDSSGITKSEVEQLQQKKQELIDINAENQKIIDSTKNATMNTVTGKETSFGDGKYLDENGKEIDIKGIYKGIWTDAFEKSGGILRQFMQLSNGDELSLDVSNSELTAWQDSPTFRDEISYYKKAYEKANGAKGWQQFYSQFDPNGYEDSGYSDNTYELMAKLGFDPDKIKKYFQEHPIDIQWKQNSYSDKDISDISQQILDNNNEILDIDDKINNSKLTKIDLMKKELQLDAQKQQNIKAIETEQQKERDELIKSLSSDGIKFNGTGDNAKALNAQDILNAKMDEVNSHRNDKNKTTYNLEKAQYDALSKDVTRFFDLQDNLISKSKQDWYALASTISKTGQAIDKAIIDSAKSELTDKSTINDNKLKSLDQISKSLLPTDMEGKLQNIKDKIAVYEQKVIDTTNSMTNLTHITATTKEGQDALNAEFSKGVDDVNSFNNSISGLKTDEQTLIETMIEGNVAKAIYGDEGQKEYENNATARVNALQDQLKVIQDINTAQTEQADLLDKQNNLTKLQTELLDIKNNKNVREYQENADGTFGYLLTYDQKAYKTKQDEVTKAQDEYNKQKKANETKAEEDSIQDQIDSINRETQIRRTALENISSDLKKALGDGTTLNQDTVTGIISKSLEDIKKITGSKFTDIVSSIQTKLNTITVPSLAPTPVSGGTTSTTSTTNSGYLPLGSPTELFGLLNGNASHDLAVENQYWTTHRHANGTLNAEGGLSLVGETGMELRVLNQGDGILSSEITKNLMELGKNPNDFINKYVLPKIPSLPRLLANTTNSKVYNINVEKVVSNNVDSFVSQLNNLVSVS